MYLLCCLVIFVTLQVLYCLSSSAVIGAVSSFLSITDITLELKGLPVPVELIISVICGINVILTAFILYISYNAVNSDDPGTSLREKLTP